MTEVNSKKIDDRFLDEVPITEEIEKEKKSIFENIKTTKTFTDALLLP